VIICSIIGCVCSGAVDEMKSEMERLCAEVLDKSSQLDRLKTEICEKTTELNNLKLESCRLEEQLNASDQQVKYLEAQHQMSTVLINDQKASLTAADEEKLQLEKIVLEYKEKTELLTVSNCELEKSIDVFKAQHQDAVQQLMALRDDHSTNSSEDLGLCVAVQSETADKLDTSCNRVDRGQASASDAANRVEEEESVQLESDLVLNRVKSEQSSNTDEELKACKEELQHLQLMAMEREKFYNDHIAQLSAELESCLSVQNAKCSDCSLKDRLIDNLNARTRSLEGELQQLVGDLECCRGELEEEKKTCKIETEGLRQQVEELAAKLRLADEQPAVNPVADNVIATLRAEIKSLKQSLDEKESVCQLYESEVERLTGLEDQLTKEIEKQQQVISKLPQTFVSGPSNDIADEISILRDQLSAGECALKEKVEENLRLRQKVEEMSPELEQLRKKQLKSTAANDSARPYSNREVQNGNQTSGADSTAVENSIESSNGDTCCQSSSNIPSDPREIAQLCSTISQQKDMLDVLNSKYASLRGLLEDRSQAQHGSSVLSDIHQLQVELRDVRADRERLLAVLGEKTRDASTLRAEVHRLTNVAAASQAALTKAQHDAQQVAAQSQQQANQDMKNEAVKKLSQMIKDKDMEIDALKLKNATLVQV